MREKKPWVLEVRVEEYFEEKDLMDNLLFEIEAITLLQFLVKIGKISKGEFSSVEVVGRFSLDNVVYATLVDLEGGKTIAFYSLENEPFIIFSADRIFGNKRLN